jgi:hypothetical protein
MRQFFIYLFIYLISHSFMVSLVTVSTDKIIQPPMIG